VFGQMKVFHFI